MKQRADKETIQDLRSDGYYLYKEDIDADYRLGLEVGLDFIHHLKNS